MTCYVFVTFMEHINDERLHQFAIEAIEPTDAENDHLADCADCWGRLVLAVKLVLREQPQPSL
jgi:hypothetical protein